jgi:aspartyl-tRNA(Asn)/glutamyl-tRNA(Gln) amidotransferase subunit B
MQKGVIRFEANVSVRPVGSEELRTRTEIKNLNSFRALKNAVEYEIKRQSAIYKMGKLVIQQTLGWDENGQKTYTQRVKEEEDDYRYFPEPDLPPLIINDNWITEIQSELPELPTVKLNRFQSQYDLSRYDATVLVAEQEVAEFFEQTMKAAGEIPAKTVVNWITGELFGWINQSGQTISNLRVTPIAFGELLKQIQLGEINQTIGKSVLVEMLQTGKSAKEIIETKRLRQVSDSDQIAKIVKTVLDANPEQVSDYRNGKDGLINWLFGQVMRGAKGKANPQVVRRELERQLSE